MHPLVRSQGTGINVSTYRLVSYGLISAMMACAGFTVVNLITRIVPTWQPWYMGIVCFLVALDRLYTYRRFRDWMVLSWQWVSHFGSQLITILILAKLIVGLSHGWPAFLAEIPLWRQDFMKYFVTNEFWVVLIMILATWMVSSNFAALLEDIGLDQKLTIQEMTAPGSIQPSARERLMSLFFGLGSLLVIFTALARLDLRGIFLEQTGLVLQDLPALAGGGASTLLYFMLGLALLSQTQFMSLHVRWSVQRIPVSSKLAGIWAAYSLAFLVFMAALVSLLPTSYSLGPLETLRYVLDFLLIFILSMAQLVLGGIFGLINAITSMFGIKTASPKIDLTKLAPTRLPNAIGTPIAPPAWWEVIKSVAFWIIFLAVLVFSVVHYLQQHEEVLEGLRKLPGWRFVEQIWGWLRGLFTNISAGVGRVVAAGQTRLRARRAAARDALGQGFLSLRNLSPRQRVAFFYLALVRRGAESGLPREASQTPSEYAATLQTALPPLDDDIDVLTDAFMEARYSRHTVAAEKAGMVRVTWERIRKVLRGYEEKRRGGKVKR